MDQLSAIFKRFNPSARVFHSGSLCQSVNFDPQDDVGYLHLLRSGTMTILPEGAEVITLDKPSLLFYPRPCSHRFQTGNTGADLVCATVNLGSAQQNPLINALPNVLVLTLDQLHTLSPALDLLFLEGTNNHSGRQAAIDRLMEYVLIQLLRFLIESRTLNHGLLAALSDPKLSKALIAIHEYPSKDWTLETLSEEAGMSRARFASHFRKTVGTTPIDYLTSWRLGIVQTLLLNGKSIKSIGREVGYRSQAALSRVFTQRCGLSPSEWARREMNS
ncbi:AraC family transcriptional regulator [Limnobacter sp. P1]|uniref:AraC family transcriptional regulator n=1 Tax=Limnobacter olei TaxID=3031298 RepID=UPI0023AFA490|nr:AraC family transcriptional regulator [Limnobacter sp. P1]